MTLPSSRAERSRACKVYVCIINRAVSTCNTCRVNVTKRRAAAHNLVEYVRTARSDVQGAADGRFAHPALLLRVSVPRRSELARCSQPPVTEPLHEPFSRTTLDAVDIAARQEFLHHARAQLRTLSPSGRSGTDTIHTLMCCEGVLTVHCLPLTPWQSCADPRVTPQPACWWAQSAPSACCPPRRYPPPHPVPAASALPRISGVSPPRPGLRQSSPVRYGGCVIHACPQLAYVHTHTSVLNIFLCSKRSIIRTYLHTRSLLHIVVTTLWVPSITACF